MRKIYIAGHEGMVGSALLRKLEERRKAGEEIIILTAPRSSLDLTDQAAVRNFFRQMQPDLVLIAAAKVGGIKANLTFPAEFIYENLAIAGNVIHQAHLTGVKRLIYLGSSCIYPPNATQPFSESSILSGPLDVSNEPYALAKIAGISLCESYSRQYGRDYRAVMPCNLYGPGDNFDQETSHVIGALLHRFHEAKLHGRKTVSLWGTGAARREFLHVDDMAAAALFVLNLEKSVYEVHNLPDRNFINIGARTDISILELAQIIAKTVGFVGKIQVDTSQPEGPLRKKLDTTRLSQLGWSERISLEEGLRQTYVWFLENHSE